MFNGSTLKALVLRGSAWTMFGHGAGQVIRLIRSLILTRLLFPEAFGLMSLVWVVMFGLEMLSDVGIASAVIRDKRGDSREFLNTAWTMQAIRGLLLWTAACLIAYPMAAFYSQPDLVHLIPVAGLTALIAGFNSTSIISCRRHMDFGRLTFLELSNEIVGLTVTILWAYFYPSVWALVGGALTGRILLLFASHAFMPGIRNALRWDPESLRELIKFGKWIFLSSAFSFLSIQSDRLLLGHYLDIAHLGIYSVAITLSDAVHSVVIKLVHGVLFPAYGKIVQQDPGRLKSVSYRARLGIDVLLIVPIAAMMVLGSSVVALLYDSRYQEAGWMLQLLCVRLVMTCTLSNSEACLVVLGQPQYAFIQNASRAIWILLGIPFGWKLLGIHGAVLAIAFSEVPVVGVLWIGLARHRMLSLASELRSLVFVGVGVLVGCALLYAFTGNLWLRN